GWAISDITQITALATLPWSLKFIFSPVIEFLDLKKIPIKNQLIFYQLMMGVTCFLFGQEIIQDRHDSLSILIFLHALFAAAQDICIDTLAIKNIAEDELGTVNGLMQAGMLIGRSLF